MILQAPTLADAAPILGERIAYPDDPRHGSRAGYDAHRRIKHPACDPCKAAAAAEEARRHVLAARGVKLRFDPCTIQRRLQALVAIGYSYQSLDRELDTGFGKARDLAVRPRAYVRRETYDKVRAVYNRLSMTPAPVATRGQRQGVAHALRTASIHGFLPPFAWDDDQLDDPAATPYVGEAIGADVKYGDTYLTDIRERAAKLLDCNDRHLSIHAACRELRVNRKTLEKWIYRHDGPCRVLSRAYADMVDRLGEVWENQNGKSRVA